VEVARQAGLCYYTPDLLDEFGKMLPFTKLSEVEQKTIIKLVEQEYLAFYSSTTAIRRSTPN
jgi:hypothetical protein